MKQVVLIFVKNAVKGKVKTRLAATLGNNVAFNVYLDLLKHTEKCTHLLNVKKIVYYSDFIESEDIWTEDVYEKQLQNGADLGERMQNAFEYAFANEHEHVAIIGSDCFEITPEIIEDAFKQLAYCDVVVGPALDGGYYLLALKTAHKALFQNIKWSTDQVLNQTLHLCHKMGLKTIELQTLSDIDNEHDLKRIGYRY
ncbi:glycosyltransferase [Pedobacter changchengzhani]|uniref:Glycosyltransferase n=1 Tax=Pedobacter changchengzhani TaxID=2529274 RepID=A0A4R5MH46_9SPHI|nr:TIGR04282 family arsenosugar biosynthesis glycosyltransferase [Pedobacter changchengzhani]TDG34832.1 glycosyltransferase [Pedobacter changchengzhani]